MDGWMEPKSVRSLQEAIDEVYRELCIRKRCMLRWIEIGKVSATDAQDRIDRMATAHDALVAQKAVIARGYVTSSGDMTAAPAG
jgi:uncharacterized protein YjcR